MCGTSPGVPWGYNSGVPAVIPIPPLWLSMVLAPGHWGRNLRRGGRCGVGWWAVHDGSDNLSAGADRGEVGGGGVVTGEYMTEAITFQPVRIAARR